MPFPQQSQASAPTVGTSTACSVSEQIASIASPLLLRRLQQQKKFAESTKQSFPISNTERVPQTPTTNVSDRMAPTPSSTKSVSGNSQRSDIGRRIEGMGAREMDQVSLLPHSISRLFSYHVSPPLQNRALITAIPIVRLQNQEGEFRSQALNLSSPRKIDEG
jgi:hypothetical protein